MIRTIHQLKPLLRQAVAALVLVQLLCAVAMAGSPSLHRDLHHDADHDDHECVVTHMLAGDIGDGVPSAVIAGVALAPLAAEPVLGMEQAAPVSPLFLKDGLLVHAPPVVD